jgi:hypothetical protein
MLIRSTANRFCFTESLITYAIVRTFEEESVWLVRQRAGADGNVHEQSERSGSDAEGNSRARRSRGRAGEGRTCRGGAKGKEMKLADSVVNNLGSPWGGRARRAECLDLGWLPTLVKAKESSVIQKFSLLQD